MRSGRSARVADSPDIRTLGHVLATGHGRSAQVCVGRLPPGAVVDHEQITIAKLAPAGEDHHAAIHCVDRIALRSGDVYAAVDARVVISGEGARHGGPDESAGPDGPFGDLAAVTGAVVGGSSRIIARDGRRPPIL